MTWKPANQASWPERDLDRLDGRLRLDGLDVGRESMPAPATRSSIAASIAAWSTAASAGGGVGAAPPHAATKSARVPASTGAISDRRGPIVSRFRIADLLVVSKGVDG